MPIRRALISVYDKTGVVEFAHALHGEFGIEIISTGGTAKLLKENGIPVTLVEDITGFPEMLDGRVKTLHPKIFAAILADRDNPEHMRQLDEMGIKPIDMVVVNLYPFEKTVADPNCRFEQAIEMIDIGGVTLLRAAAKNHKDVLVSAGLPNAEGPEALLSYLRNRTNVPWDWLRTHLAFSAFWQTHYYEQQIRDWFDQQCNKGQQAFGRIAYKDWGLIRYGENPHQEARLLGFGGLLDLPVADAPTDEYDQQPQISYNNYLDSDAALRLCADLTRERAKLMLPQSKATEKCGTRACVFIKHNNACGVGIAADPIEAYRRAYLGDPNAAMGGILAVNFEVTPDFAAAVMDTLARWGKEAGAGAFFLEVWLAPQFTEDAVKLIRGTAEPTAAIPNPPKKPWGEKVRLLAVGDMNVEPDPNALEYRSIAGGMLVQTPDLVGLNEDHWKVVTKRAPTESEMSDLRLAWLIAKHTKSNAISLVRDGMLIGNGAGQMSRVMSCRIAVWLARENGHLEEGNRQQATGNRQEATGDGQQAMGNRHEAAGDEQEATGSRDQAEGGGSSGAVAASDAFFPFRDGPDILIDAGVTAIIQPGGSKRDAEVIAACDERGVAMILTGTRHFRH